MINVLLLHVFRGPDTTFLPDAWMERRGYERVRTSEGAARVETTYFSSERRQVLDLLIEPLPARTAPKFAPKDRFFADRAVPLYSFKSGVPSGLPIGTDVRLMVDKSWGINMVFLTPWAYGSINVRTRNTDGAPLLPSDDEVTLAEGVARQTLAALEARRLDDADRRDLGGASVPVYDLAGLDVVELSAWAKARGWAVKTDDDLGIATLTKAERKLRIPLGAASVEVDGTWKDLPDVVTLKDGKWWVPLKALETVSLEK